MHATEYSEKKVQHKRGAEMHIADFLFKNIYRLQGGRKKQQEDALTSQADGFDNRIHETG